MTATSQLVTAGDLGTFRGGSGFPLRLQGRKSGDLPFFKVSDMNNSGNELFMRRANNYISEAERKALGATRFPAGAIVFAKVGAAVFLERKRILAQDSCIDNNMAGFIVDQDRIDVRFAHYFITTFKMSSLVATTALPSLNGSQLRSIPLLVPEDPQEQRRIAAALSDVDYLIAALERMIAKKEAIKQGMMQQLLTGKTRLPGFMTPWRECAMGDVLTVRHGKNQSAVENPRGLYPILATGGQIGRATMPLYSKPSVLIGRKGTIDRPQYMALPFWTVDTLFYTEIDASTDPRYLYYVFLTIDWRSMNEASGVPSLSTSRVEGVEIRLPEIDEQRAIREVLDTADREIVLLRRRLRKARDAKQGMLQELLTGHTRLRVEEGAA